MSLFSFFQKIKYTLRAKSRHGVHSPFVYHFIEKILNEQLPDKDIDQLPYWKSLNLSTKQMLILDRICSYFQINAIHLDGNQTEIAANNSDRRLLIYSDPAQIEFDNDEDDIIVILKPYSSQEKYMGWEKLISNTKIPLTLDIFEMGILFFRKEFLVKQHFYLQY